MLTRTETLIADEITATLGPFAGCWVGLVDVRAHLSRWDRAAQDSTLRKMAELQAVRLAKQSSRQPLTREDRAAALIVDGQIKHLIWLPE